MNFADILRQKPHNPHYLSRYIRFIQSYTTTTFDESQYVERHHICPKAKDLFPEYSNMRKHQWNCVKLPLRAHVIAHYILHKAYNTTSTALAVMRTAGQWRSQFKYCSRMVLIARQSSAESKKGKFPRGYKEDGTANVSERTRQIISQHKVAYYADPANRAKTSAACKGTTGRNSPKYSAAALNRSASHRQKLQQARRDQWDALTSTERSIIRMRGVYVTPFGHFTQVSPTFADYCMRNDVVFTRHHTKGHSILPEEVVGKTPSDLGFAFIPKTDPTVSLYYDGLNQVRPPEPNHPLVSLLSDCRLHKILLPGTSARTDPTSLLS